jgi:DNA-binding beta-propeller fold protein YncE
MSGAVTTGDGLPVLVPKEPTGSQGPGTPETPAPEGPAVPEAPADRDEDKRRRRAIALLLLLLALLTLLIGIAIWYFLFRQPIPLPVPTVVDLPAYTTAMYGADGPVGVASSPDGSRIYVAQSGGDHVVLIFDAAGNQVGRAEPPASTGSEHVPVWLALDPLTSQLYVSDRPKGQVYVYDADGGYMHTFTATVPIPGWQPMGLAFDTAGNLYVADLAGPNRRVEKYDRSGNLVQTFGEADHLNFPNGVAVDAKGNVIIADSNNGRLMAYRPDGTLLAQVGRGVGVGELGMPRGVAIDGRERIYIGDTTAQAIEVMQLDDGSAPSIQHLGLLGGPGIEDGRFTYPNGVAVDGRGRIYVSDTGNDRVQLWSY